MEYTDRHEQRKVQETFNSLLSSIIPYLNEETKGYVETGLRILNNTEIAKQTEQTNEQPKPKELHGTGVQEYVSESMAYCWRVFESIRDHNYSDEVIKYYNEQMLKQKSGLTIDAPCLKENPTGIWLYIKYEDVSIYVGGKKEDWDKDRKFVPKYMYYTVKSLIQVDNRADFWEKLNKTSEVKLLQSMNAPVTEKEAKDFIEEKNATLNNSFGKLVSYDKYLEDLDSKIKNTGIKYLIQREMEYCQKIADDIKNDNYSKNTTDYYFYENIYGRSPVEIKVEPEWIRLHYDGIYLLIMGDEQKFNETGNFTPTGEIEYQLNYRDKDSARIINENSMEKFEIKLGKLSETLIFHNADVPTYSVIPCREYVNEKMQKLNNYMEYFMKENDEVER